MSRIVSVAGGLLLALALSGCQSASELLFEPKATDPLDGVA